MYELMFKKIISLMLVACMVLALGVTVSAADEGEMYLKVTKNSATNFFVFGHYVQTRKTIISTNRVLLIHHKWSPFSAGEGSFCLRLCLNESPSFSIFLAQCDSPFL